MAKKLPPGLTQYLAEIGRKGGKSKVPKGLASLTKEERREIAMKGVAARRAKAKAEAGGKA